MHSTSDGFVERIRAVLTRYFGQNGQSGPDPVLLRDIAGRLWALIEERGLPRPLRVDERGEPGEMSEAECVPLVDRTLAGESDPLMREGVRQLVKACFYPEFKTCRDSFREVGPDNSCRRQELDRVRRRVSGAHCVDCPYWTSLTPEQHERFLRENWRASAADFAAHRSVFLPEDFRELRRWVRRAAEKGRL